MTVIAELDVAAGHSSPLCAIHSYSASSWRLIFKNCLINPWGYDAPPLCFHFMSSGSLPVTLHTNDTCSSSTTVALEVEKIIFGGSEKT